MSDSITFDGETPRNRQFGDTYFSKADGRAETSHVFIGCNDLPERWAKLASGEGFTVAELGFGTGLNFFETVRQWNASGSKGTLTFISFEAFPMPVTDLTKSLAPWPEMAAGARWISSIWPPERGWHTFEFLGVKLRLFMGDANAAIADISTAIDAWYLDGFAPSRNPGLWGADLMQQVFACTAAGGTFATYTSAGWVRRNLQDAGFAVQKFPGHAGKREMMRGIKPALISD